MQLELLNCKLKHRITVSGNNQNFFKKAKIVHILSNTLYINFVTELTKLFLHKMMTIVSEFKDTKSRSQSILFFILLNEVTRVSPKKASSDLQFNKMTIGFYVVQHPVCHF